jgi:mono/diheme cytochrome c family protein
MKMQALNINHRRRTIAFSKLTCCVISALTAWSLSGCGPGPQAEFKLRDSTEALIPDAQREMRKALTENFGTPQKLVAWARFPVDYGGVTGVVIEPKAGTHLSANSVFVKLDADGEKVVAKSPMLWLSGGRSDAKGNDAVAEFDPSTSLLAWTGAADPKPAVGDRFVIGFGHALQQGRVVYMKNCMHCHGVSGDGAGPTAQYLNPLPRDYRLGLFKFTSTLTPEKPTRDDLHRIVRYGIPGTYMPSFLLLGESETASVVEYVRWLSMRGEFEKRAVDDMADYSTVAIEDLVSKANDVYKAAMEKYEADRKKGETTEKPEKPDSVAQAKSKAAKAFEEYMKEELSTSIDDTATFIATAWTHGEDAESKILPKIPRVADDAASRERGRLMYLSDKAKCYTCHGMQGRGDGAATEDFWKKPGSDELYPRRGLHDSWGHPLKPRNLTLGQYRGGRRPIDVFRRVYAGIKGTPMPGFGGTALKDEEIWDVVNFVMSLQYQSPKPVAPSAGGHATENPTTASK